LQNSADPLLARLIIPALKQQLLLSRDREGVIMALRAWASLARLDKLKLIPHVGHALAML
jgi:hypothetical protein